MDFDPIFGAPTAIRTNKKMASRRVRKKVTRCPDEFLVTDTSAAPWCSLRLLRPHVLLKVSFKLVVEIIQDKDLFTKKIYEVAQFFEEHVVGTEFPNRFIRLVNRDQLAQEGS